MTHKAQNESTVLDTAIAILAESGFDGLAQAVTTLINEPMIVERTAYIGVAPHERSSERNGWANGFKPKTMATEIGALELRVPQVRDRSQGAEPFYPSILERGDRRTRALKLAVVEMYVQGFSTRRVKETTRELCGLDVSSTQVSRAAKALDQELEAWGSRGLGEVRYLVLDATYGKVRRDGSVQDAAILVAKAVLPDGSRMIAGVSVGHSEAEVHWRDFLEGLQDRGMHGVQNTASDDHAGLRAAIQARFPGGDLAAVPMPSSKEWSFLRQPL